MTTTVKILPEEIEILKRMAAEFYLEVFIHEENPSDNSILRKATISGFIDEGHIWNVASILADRKHNAFLEKQLEKRKNK